MKPRRRPRLAGYLVAFAAGAALVFGLHMLKGGDERKVTDVVEWSGPSSGRLVPTATETARARRAALGYWHGTRCTGSIPVLHAALSDHRLATAHWHYDSDVAGVYFACEITFNKARRFTYPMFCTAMVHEYGHLDGFREAGGPDGGTHSRRPTSVMYPRLSARNVPHGCKV